MKKVIFIIMTAIIFTGCGIYKTVDLGVLTIGMSKAEVAMAIGSPQRVLTVNQTQNGYLEVLEYRTYQNEIYALEFWDDYLTGYEFLYDDVVYVPAPAPPIVRPVYGRPVFPDYYRPVKPVKPNYPSNNNNKPGVNNRPTEKPTRPDANVPNNTTRSTNTRTTTRSSESNRSSETRQSTSTSTRSSENNGTTRQPASTSTRSSERSNSSSGNSGTNTRSR